MQQQEKQHAHEKEMQRPKLQQVHLLQQDVNVVHQQKDLQDEELLAEQLQEELLAEQLQEKLLAEELQEKLQEDLPQEEGDVNLPSFFYFNLSEYPKAFMSSKIQTL